MKNYKLVQFICVFSIEVNLHKRARTHTPAETANRNAH